MNSTGQERAGQGDRISINKDGIVLNSLSRSKARFTADIVHLEFIGTNIFERLVDASPKNEVPFAKPINILSRAVYQLGRDLLTDKKGAERLVHIMRQSSSYSDFRRIRSDAPHASQNPFFWFFHLLVREETKSERNIFVSSSQRTKLAKELLYAHKNNVPPEYLTGFILQIGRARAVKLCDAENWEGWKTNNRKVLLEADQTLSAQSPETPS